MAPQKVNLPPEENGDPHAVYAEDSGNKYRLATIRDFVRVRNMITSEEGWGAPKYTSATVNVWAREAPAGTLGAGLNVVKVIAEFPGIAPSVFYDALHDPDFRKSWDDKMISGVNICVLDPRNDIGYYAAKFPWPLANRDFVNLRSWVEASTGEYMIMNRSVLHPAFPITSKFVRGLSYVTGYFLQPLVEGGDRTSSETGVRLQYLAHADPQGSIPYSLLNMTMTSMVPSMMATLATRAKEYPQWAAKNHPEGFRGPWLTPMLTWEGKEVSEQGGEPSPVAAAGAASASSPVAAEQQPEEETEGERQLAREERAAAEQHEKRKHRRREAAPEEKQEEAVATQHEDEEPAGTSAQSREEVAALQAQLEEVKQRLRTAELQGLLGGDDAASLAPVAPRRSEDPPAVQQFRAMMSDALNFVDRQYLHEGRSPSSVVEYLTRVRAVVDGVRKTIPTPSAV